MRISTKGRYGIRLMIALLRHYREGPVPVKHISKKEKISIDYIEQLFIRFKRCGLVRSIRGCKGGFLLARTPSDISIGDILRCAGESIALTPCILVGKRGCYNCPLCGRCEAQRFFEEITIRLREMIESKSLLSLFDGPLNREVEPLPSGEALSLQSEHQRIKREGMNRRR